MGFGIMQARNKITQRGAKLGIDFDAEVAKLRAAADWNQELQVGVFACLGTVSLPSGVDRFSVHQ